MRELSELVSDPKTLDALDHLYGLAGWEQMYQIDNEAVAKAIYFPPQVWWHYGDGLLCLFGSIVSSPNQLDNLIVNIGAKGETRLVGYAESEFLLIQLGFTDRVEGYVKD